MRGMFFNGKQVVTLVLPHNGMGGGGLRAELYRSELEKECMLSTNYFYTKGRGQSHTFLVRLVNQNFLAIMNI